MDINITTVKPQININTQNANLYIKQPLHKFELSYDIDRVDIDIQHTKVEIDQSACLYEMGLSSPVDKYREYISRAYTKASRGIKEIVEQGDALAQIENGQNMIAQLAKHVYTDDRDYNVDCMPKSRPEIYFSGGVKIDIKEGYFDVYVDADSLDISASFPSVDIHVTRPYIQIEYTGKNIDRYI